MTIKSILLFIFGLLALFLGFVLVAFNSDVIHLDLLFWQKESMNAGVALLIAFVLGGVCGLLVGIGLWGKVKQQVQVRNLTKALESKHAHTTSSDR